MKDYLKLFNLVSLILFTSLNIKTINCYYALPLKTTYYYNNPSAKDEVASNYLTNYIYTELDIGTPGQYLSTLIKSKSYCSYIAAYICKLEDSNYVSDDSSTFEQITNYDLKFEDFSDACLANEKMKLSQNVSNSDNLDTVDFNKFFHAPYNTYSSEFPNTCGVFAFGHSSSNSYQCGNLIETLSESNSKNSIFTVDYAENSNGTNNGSIVIGAYPYEYDSDHYNENNYTEADFKNYAIEFNEISFLNTTNNKTEEIYTSSIKSASFLFEQNMFVSPSGFFENGIVNKIFNDYINDGTCEKMNINSNGIAYKVIVCEKKKFSNYEEFYENFPKLVFSHSEMNMTFEFEAKELLVEKGSYVYFMIASDLTNSQWILGKIFLEKYLMTYDYKNLKIYHYIYSEKEETKTVKTFSYLHNGIGAIIVIALNVLVLVIYIIVASIKACRKTDVDPTIMIETDEELKQKMEEEKKKEEDELRKKHDVFAIN